MNYYSPMFERAIEIARGLWSPSHPLRCFHTTVIFNKGKVVSIGINGPKTHTANTFNPKFVSKVNVKLDGGCCSELKAILYFKNRTNIPSKKCSLVNIRINKKGEIKNSRPCASCENLLKYFEFNKVYYSTNEGNFEQY